MRYSDWCSWSDHTVLTALSGIFYCLVLFSSELFWKSSFCIGLLLLFLTITVSWCLERVVLSYSLLILTYTVTSIISHKKNWHCALMSYNNFWHQFKSGWFKQNFAAILWWNMCLLDLRRHSTNESFYLYNQINE